MELNEKRVQHHIKNFERAIGEYTAKEPLARFLTRYYKNNRQMGSSDRRMTSRLCYNYFRIGAWKKNAPLIERLVYAEYLCEIDSDIVRLLDPELYRSMNECYTQKIAKAQADIQDFFPWAEKMSVGIDKETFLKSQLVQPDLFIRLKRGSEHVVLAELNRRNMRFEQLSEQSIALPNGTRLHELGALDGLYEVQDLSSQQTLQDMPVKPGERWWDACAASGGKALLFLDRYPEVDLLVSDVRLSILRNLDERFERAKIKTPYRKKVIDLTKDTESILGGEKFDGIILDVPCSGSGTWGRTPEMKMQCSEDKLAAFAELQRKIAANVVHALKPGKSLTYITCSAYRSENEDIIAYLMTDHHMTLDRMQILHGYRHKADTMFVARLFKS